MTDIGTCRGERRNCSAPAVVVRQGRGLCEDCDATRKASRNRRGKRAKRRKLSLDAPAMLALIRLHHAALARGLHETGDGSSGEDVEDALAWLADALDWLSAHGS